MVPEIRIFYPNPEATINEYGKFLRYLFAFLLILFLYLFLFMSLGYSTDELDLPPVVWRLLGLIFPAFVLLKRFLVKKDKPVFTIGCGYLEIHRGKYKGRYYIRKIHRIELVSNNLDIFLKDVEDKIYFDFEHIKEEERDEFINILKQFNVDLHIDQSLVQANTFAEKVSKL